MRALKTIGVVTALLVTAACTTNPYTGERQASKAATYGGGAAVLCGLVGAIDSGKHARNAALGCGIVGAGVGAYMDVQEKKLRDQLQGTGVSVVRDGDSIRLVMPGNITFETDSYGLRGTFYPVLNSVGEVLAKYGDTTIRVTGFTDSTGSAAHNQTLSEQRAQSVADYLVTRQVARERMLVEGRGASGPIADNGTAAGRAENRRVELHILPKTT